MRVAVSAVLDKGIRAAKEAGAVRAARLAKRDRAIASEQSGGREPWREAIG